MARCSSGPFAGVSMVLASVSILDGKSKILRATKTLSEELDEMILTMLDLEKLTIAAIGR